MQSILRLLSLLGLFFLSVNADGTDQEGLDFLAENAKKEGVISLASGLQYKVLTKGEGAYHPTKDSPCSCHYEGKLLNGKVFDSSYERGEPTTFAPNQVIKGWTEAMQLMVEGDKFELYIPSELAYGDSGAGADIPAGAVLTFQIEIIDIEGDKVAALTCNPFKDQPDSECNEKEQNYVIKMRTKSEEEHKKQLDRLNKMAEEKMTSDLKSWIERRVHILNQLVHDSPEKKEEEL
mmetsp:Transcript_32511/g.36013  ORF Transcript_32511/g.36013 Transcript_32511/m.36013 type:complete len:235 (-) Transcript_32511:109-813(-)